MSTPPLVLQGMNCRNTGLENELKILRIIRIQGWIREYELSILSGFGIDKVELICRRLASKGEVERFKQFGNCGVFVILTRSGANRVGGATGKKVVIPKSWKHDALAIQSLEYLSSNFKQRKNIVTEAMLKREFASEGKIPDGKLDGESMFFEQEWSSKSGKVLEKQSRKIVEKANNGLLCVIAYPHPPEICDGINHEERQIRSFLSLRRNDDAEIMLMRCMFDNPYRYSMAKASDFHLFEFKEILDATGRNETAIIVSKEPKTRDKEPAQYSWVDQPSQQDFMFESHLMRSGIHVTSIKFRKGHGEELDSADISYVDELDSAEDSQAEYIENDDPDVSFEKFVRHEKLRIEMEWMMGDLAP